MRRLANILLGFSAAAALGVAAAAAAPAGLTFTTLGTNSGPIPRSNPV